jgi:hypothetical protein
MHAHVRLAGHGIAVVPRIPFSLERHGGRGGDAVVATHRPAAGLPRRLLLVPGDGGCRVELQAGTASAGEVAEVGAGPPAAGWRLEAGGFSMAWPEGFAVHSGPAPEATPGFDLVAPGGLLLFPQGPLPAGRAADRRALVGPGQRLLEEGGLDDAPWVEVSDTRELAPWRLRHALIPVAGGLILLTLEAPEDSVGTPAWAAAVEAAKTVRPA